MSTRHSISAKERWGQRGNPCTSPLPQATQQLQGTLLTFILHLCRAHDGNGDTNHRGQGPDGHIHSLGFAGGANIQGSDGMADSHIAVDTHGSQGEGASKHVVVVDGNDGLAHGIAEWPEAQQDVSALERQSKQHQGVCQGQVENIDVGGCLHLGVPAGARVARHVLLGQGQTPTLAPTQCSGPPALSQRLVPGPHPLWWHHKGGVGGQNHCGSIGALLSTKESQATRLVWVDQWRHRRQHT